MIGVEADTTAIEHLDFPPRCESINHDTSSDHSGVAAFMQYGPCAHTTGLRCATFVARVKPMIRCEFCVTAVPASTYRWEPLT